jgi:hypothetical protein
LFILLSRFPWPPLQLTEADDALSRGETASMCGEKGDRKGHLGFWRAILVAGGAITLAVAKYVSGVATISHVM